MNKYIECSSPTEVCSQRSPLYLLEHTMTQSLRPHDNATRHTLRPSSETYTFHGSAEQPVTSILPCTRVNLQHDTRIVEPFCHAKGRSKMRSSISATHVPLTTVLPVLLLRTSLSYFGSLTSHPFIIHSGGVASPDVTLGGGASCLLGRTARLSF